MCLRGHTADLGVFSFTSCSFPVSFFLGVVAVPLSFSSSPLFRFRYSGIMRGSEDEDQPGYDVGRWIPTLGLSWILISGLVCIVCLLRAI